MEPGHQMLFSVIPRTVPFGREESYPLQRMLSRILNLADRVVNFLEQQVGGLSCLDCTQLAFSIAIVSDSLTVNGTACAVKFFFNKYIYQDYQHLTYFEKQCFKTTSLKDTVRSNKHSSTHAHAHTDLYRYIFACKYSNWHKITVNNKRFQLISNRNDLGIFLP